MHTAKSIMDISLGTESFLKSRHLRIVDYFLVTKIFKYKFYCILFNKNQTQRLIVQR